MSNWYMADSHFGADSKEIMEREKRPFKDILEYTKEQVRIWNDQASSEDVIYAIGDFCNYNSSEKDYMSGLAVSSMVNARIILITGTQEERVIRDHFDGDFEKFRQFCLDEPSFKFEDVVRNAYVDVPEGEAYRQLFAALLNCEAHLDVWQTIYKTWHRDKTAEQK